MAEIDISTLVDSLSLDAETRFLPDGSMPLQHLQIDENIDYYRTYFSGDSSWHEVTTETDSKDLGTPGKNDEYLEIIQFYKNVLKCFR